MVANTPRTLILGDLSSGLVSEVPWTTSGKEKYFFDYPTLCMVHSVGELSLIEYGNSEILGSCRTEYMNPRLIRCASPFTVCSAAVFHRKVVLFPAFVSTSARCVPPLLRSALPPQRHETTNAWRTCWTLKTSASWIWSRALTLRPSTTIPRYDSLIICLLSVGFRSLVLVQIDWLDLNARGDLVLFRDKRRKLHVFDITSQSRNTLLTYASFATWVPNSDVVVSQSRNTLCVWYNIFAPDKMTTRSIKGDIEVRTFFLFQSPCP